MKEKMIIGIRLFLVAAFSGYILFLINSFTKPVIDENRKIRTEEMYKEIFSDIDTYEKIENTDIPKTAIKDSSGNVLGYVYSASMVNGYGQISLLVGINNDSEIVNVVFAELNQTPTYASKVNNEEFLSKFIGNSTSMDYADFDVKVGATYSASTTRDIVATISKYHEEVQ